MSAAPPGLDVAWATLRAHAEADGWVSPGPHAADAWFASAPALPVDSLGLEVRLDGDPRVDVGLQLRRGVADLSALARWAGPEAAPIVARWGSSDSPYLWVEADQRGEGLRPFGFATVADDLAFGATRTPDERLLARLTHLFPGAVDPPTAAWLAARPGGVDVLHAAELPTDRGGGLRLHLHGASPVVRAWLAPQLPAPAARHLDAAGETLGQGGHAVGVQVTLRAGRLVPEVGLELHRSVPPSYTDSWQRVLAPLVRSGAATPDRAAALPRWWGPSAGGTHRAFYLKVTATPERLTAKGYLVLLRPSGAERTQG